MEEIKHYFYACFEDKNGKITKIRFCTREEARACVSAHVLDENYVSVWTE